MNESSTSPSSDNPTLTLGTLVGHTITHIVQGTSLLCGTMTSAQIEMYEGKVNNVTCKKCLATLKRRYAQIQRETVFASIQSPCVQGTTLSRLAPVSLPKYTYIAPAKWSRVIGQALKILHTKILKKNTSSKEGSTYLENIFLPLLQRYEDGERSLALYEALKALKHNN